MNLRIMVLLPLLIVFLLATARDASPVSYVPPQEEMNEIHEESMRPATMPELPAEFAQLLAACMNRPCLSNNETLLAAATVAQVYTAALSQALQRQYREEGNGDPEVRADVLEAITSLQNLQVTIHRVRMRAHESQGSRR